MSWGLSDAAILQIKAVFKRYEHVDKVVIYGSRAMGTYKNGSDIDLTIMGRGVTFQLLTELLSDLDQLDLPYTFDLSSYDSLKNPTLTDHINRVGQVFYEREEKL